MPRRRGVHLSGRCLATSTSLRTKPSTRAPPPASLPVRCRRTPWRPAHPASHDPAVVAFGFPDACASSPAEPRPEPSTGAPDSTTPATLLPPPPAAGTMPPARAAIAAQPSRQPPAASRAASRAEMSRVTAKPSRQRHPCTVGSSSDGPDRSKTRSIPVNQSRPHHFCKRDPDLSANQPAVLSSSKVISFRSSFFCLSPCLFLFLCPPSLDLSFTLWTLGLWV